MINTLTTTLHRLPFSWQARRMIKRLRQSEDDETQKLAQALALTLSTTATPPPLAAIETLRTTLQQSTTPITFRDYGAGDRLTSDQYREKPYRTITRTVRALTGSAVPAHEGRLLYHLIRQFNPQRCLELGTSLGISAAYQAAALASHGHTGRLLTLEGGKALARLAEKNLHQLGMDTVVVTIGAFAETLPTVLPTHSPIDFAFIDGHHDPKAMRAYFEQLVPYLTDGAVLLFDDIFWTTGMRHAWLALAADPRVRHPVDLLTVGLCLYNASPQP